MMELERLREAVESRVTEKRMKHILGCEEEVVRLAERWGEDSQVAATAAILHDITKCLSYEAQLNLCDKYAIMLDNVQRKQLKLLHALTGAAVAEFEFDAPQEVCEAIRWHTTGKAGMSLLDKIIYLADYIEPTRDFEGVERLRDIAYRDLDRAILMGLNMSFQELIDKNSCIHQNSLEARNWMILKGTSSDENVRK